MKFFLSGCVITLLLIAVGTYVFLSLGFFSFRADQTLPVSNRNMPCRLWTPRQNATRPS